MLTKSLTRHRFYSFGSSFYKNQLATWYKHKLNTSTSCAIIRKSATPKCSASCSRSPSHYSLPSEHPFQGFIQVPESENKQISLPSRRSNTRGAQGYLYRQGRVYEGINPRRSADLTTFPRPSGRPRVKRVSLPTSISTLVFPIQPNVQVTMAMPFRISLLGRSHSSVHVRLLMREEWQPSARYSC